MPTNTSWYHANAKPVSRSDGKSYVGLVAYTIDQPIYDQYNKRTCGRNHAGEVASWGIVAGAPCPSSFLDKSQIDKTANAYETHKKNRINAHLSIHFDFALWRNGTPEQNEELTRRIAQRYADRHKVLVVYGVHAPSGEGSDKNAHGHFAPTMLRVTNEGFGEKARELQDGERKRELIWARAMIAEETNRFLQSVNSDERVSHESYRARGILKQPMVHMGAKAWQAEKRGVKTELGEKNRGIRAENDAFEAQQQKHADNIIRYNDEIAELKKERRKRMSPEEQYAEDQRQQIDQRVKEQIDIIDQLRVHRRDSDQIIDAFKRDQDAAQKLDEDRLRRRTQDSDITDATTRWLEAVADSPRQQEVEKSMAAAVAIEGARAKREHDELTKDAAGQKDPDKKKDILLRRDIQFADYMALTEERQSGISRVVTGFTTRRDLNGPDIFDQPEIKRPWQEHRESAMEWREKANSWRADRQQHRINMELREIDQHIDLSRRWNQARDAERNGTDFTVSPDGTVVPERPRSVADEIRVSQKDSDTDRQEGLQDRLQSKTQPQEQREEKDARREMRDSDNDLTDEDSVRQAALQSRLEKSNRAAEVRGRGGGMSR